jgi:hypothetical protein
LHSAGHRDNGGSNPPVGICKADFELLDAEVPKDVEGDDQRISYSTHDCIGDVPSLGDDPVNRNGMCLFHNVCLLKGSLHYFMHPQRRNQDLPQLHLAARLFEHDPVLEVSIKAAEGGFERDKVAFEEKLHMYILMYAYSNLGHVLGDTCWPIWQAMFNFNLVNADNQIILEDSPITLHPEATWSSGSPLVPQKQQFKTVSKNEVRFMSSYVDYEQVCFKNFITGWGLYGYGSGSSQHLMGRTQAWGRGAHFRAWREFAYTTNEIVVSEPKWRHQRDSFGFLIVLRHQTAQHPSFITNPEEIRSSIQKTYPFSHSRITTWSGLSMRDQLEILANSHAVISLPGSDIMNMIFLPDHALLILPCRYAHDGMSCEEKGWKEPAEEATLWLHHVPLLRVVEYCGHKQENVDGYNVRVLPGDVLAYIRDWQLSLSDTL